MMNLEVQGVEKCNKNFKSTSLLNPEYDICRKAWIHGEYLEEDGLSNKIHPFVCYSRDIGTDSFRWYSLPCSQNIKHLTVPSTLSYQPNFYALNRMSKSLFN
jgi:hypothetical protein